MELFFLIYFTLITLGVIFLVKSRKRVVAFYEKCNNLEKKIKDGEDVSTVVDEIFELNKEVFHYRLGARIRELSKMAEVKYGVKILKDE